MLQIYEIHDVPILINQTIGANSNPGVSFSLIVTDLGKPSREKSAVFLNIVQKAFDPPPLSFEHHVVNFF